MKSHKDVFTGAPHESSAADYGTLGLDFSARKPINDEEWAEAMAKLTSEVPPALA